MDLTPLVNAFAPVAQAATIAALGVLVPFVLNRLHVANNSDLGKAVATAADAAAGAAYKYALAHDGGLKNIQVHNAALEVGADYVLRNMPGALDKLGLTPEHVQDMVEARLGALLAQDPTVTAGTPPQHSSIPVTGV